MTLARISERCNDQSMPRAQILLTGSCTAKADKNVVTLHLEFASTDLEKYISAMLGELLALSALEIPVLLRW